MYTHNSMAPLFLINFIRTRHFVIFLYTFKVNFQEILLWSVSIAGEWRNSEKEGAGGGSEQNRRQWDTHFNTEEGTGLMTS